MPSHLNPVKMPMPLSIVFKNFVEKDLKHTDFLLLL